MRTVPLAVVAAALVACSPRVPAAQEVPARSGPYALEAIDEGGRLLPTFAHRGRTYVLGALGQRYLLRFRNGSRRRVEVVASVDGRDVVDGRPASFARRGYVVEPRGEVTIDGFRVSEDAVAAFRFSTVPRSYAARKGDARDVGVVGLAVFPERRPPEVPRPPYAPRPLPPPDAGGARDDAERRAEAAPAPEGGVAPRPPSARGSEPSSARSTRRASRRPRSSARAPARRPC